MKDKFFLDTNILLYVFDERTRAEGLIQSGVREGTGCISHKVVREAFNAIKKTISCNNSKGASVS